MTFKIFSLILALLMMSVPAVGLANVDELSPATVAPSQEAIPLPILYETVSPSVVYIQVRNGEAFGSSVFPTGGLGSGFVYDQSGHIVTNFHVVEGATDIDVTFFDGTFARADVIGTDPDSDIAVIRVSEVPVERLVPVSLGNSAEIRVGEDVIAIGNPFGQDWTMTTGIVSAVGRSNRGQTGFSIAQMIQTDAAINPGNSGGPLLNARGEVIGINTLIFTETSVSSGVGFAVPVDTVKRVVPELIERGFFEYTWIGISGGDLNLDIIELLNLDRDVRGVQVSRVVEDGPAARAGLRGNSTRSSYNGFNYEIGGDIITAIDGSPIRSMSELINYLNESTRPGDAINLTIIRDNSEQSIIVNLEARPNTAN